MRIISGEFKRRLLKTPPDDTVTRPIPDRVKESLFSILRGHYEGATVFDGFAGTGAIGLEAVSRGAVKCVFVEKDRGIVEILRENVATLGADDRCEVLCADALGPGALARAARPLHLAFLDPPYPLVRDRTGFARVMDQMEKLIALLDDTGFAVVRTPWPLKFEIGGELAEPEIVPENGRNVRKKGKDRNGWMRDLDEPAKVKPGKPAGKVGTPPVREEPEFEDVESDDPDHNDDYEEGDIEETEFLDPAELEAAMNAMPTADEGAPLTDAELPPPPKQYEEANLTIPNADGPETHVYHGMAIHLYMRKKPVLIGRPD